MFCPKCGTETADDSQFCRKCGSALNATAAPAPIKAKPRVRTPFKIAGVLLLLFLGFIVVLLILPNKNGTSAIQQLGKQQHTALMNNPALTIKPIGYYAFKMDVPPGAVNVHLQGSFTASGGIGNDIDVAVLPQDDFVNWQNRHASRSFYNSGKATVGNINVNLPADSGTYYLVFDNRFSLLSEKTIRVNATLAYYQ
jgi:zinc-ribbon domain